MTTDLLSVIIPARNEVFLYKTVQDILAKAKGPIEIAIVLDGYWMKAEEIIDDPRITYINYGEARGMRNAINMGVNITKGEYLLKCDAHCMFDQGFDVKLKQDVSIYNLFTNSTNWIVIPRRNRLRPRLHFSGAPIRAAPRAAPAAISHR